MVNFKKALEKKDSKQRVSPIEIYDNLNRVASVGPLRPIQEDVLSTWYNGQMENHCGWFETKYPEVPVRYIMIHQTTKVSKLANFTHDVRVMNKENLERLKNQIRSFVKELKCIDFHAVDEFTIAKWLQTHNLSIKNLEDDYCGTCKSAHP